MSGFARIWNLGSDLNLWTSTGTDAKPLLEWSASDVDGDGVTVTVRIYKTSSGTKDDANRVYIASGLSNTGSHQANWGMKNDSTGVDTSDGHGPVAYYTVEAIDQYGESSGESARIPFKVSWGQAVYEYNVGVGAGSLQFTHASVVGADAGFLFRNAGSNGATPTAWVTSIGAIATTLAYVNVLVRLSTYTSASNATLPDMTLQYQVTAQTPDNWSLSPVGHWTLDLDVRRYGDKCVKCIVSTAAYHYVEPYRLAAGDGIPVSPNTDYVFSCFVKTQAPLTANHYVVLQVRSFTDFNTVLKTGQLTGDEYNDGPGASSDSSAYPEGWQRLHIHYRTGAAETIVRVIPIYLQSIAGVVSTPSNTGDVFWLDAVKWEEGTVVSAWTPGFISPAMVLDSYGLMADASLGGKMGLKASGGNIASIDSIVQASDLGAKFHSGAGSPNSVVVGNIGDFYLNTTGGASTTLYVKESGAGTNTGWVAK